MDNAQPPALPEAHTQNPETAPSKPPVTKKDEVLGCGCLIIVALGLVMLLKSCFFGGSSTDNLSPDYKLACIDAAAKLPSDAPQIAEYKRLLTDFSSRFDCTENQIAAATITVVDELEKGGVKSTTLALMQDVHKAAMSKSSEQLGFKGIAGYSRMLAQLAAIMQSRHAQ